MNSRTKASPPRYVPGSLPFQDPERFRCGIPAFVFGTCTNDQNSVLVVYFQGVHVTTGINGFRRARTLTCGLNNLDHDGAASLVFADAHDLAGDSRTLQAALIQAVSDLDATTAT